ncbi:uncharacterized protein LOC127259494 [Andrographis paniculata]|uniref:uncharacterized protein LOC127259494 n=1 Tax=Andrographis paniculata TaxID=175694 RepID=UPI0021E918EA|nr:uncharacterized protein LOC127259494 [Andrographis paniculata]
MNHHTTITHNNQIHQRKQKQVAEDSPPPAMAETNNNNYNLKEVATDDSPATAGDSSVRPPPQQIPNIAAPSPLSFTAFLISGIEADRNFEQLFIYHVTLIQHNQTSPSTKVEKLTKNIHGFMQEERLMQEAGIAAAAKRLKEKEIELSYNRARAKKAEVERKAEELLTEATKLAAKKVYLEKEMLHLRADLQQAAAARRQAEAAAREQAESLKRRVRIDCRRCNRVGVATLQVMPCCHISVCRQCEPTTRFCPICRTWKTGAVEAPLYSPDD